MEILIRVHRNPAKLGILQSSSEFINTMPTPSKMNIFSIFFVHFYRHAYFLRLKTYLCVCVWVWLSRDQIDRYRCEDWKLWLLKHDNENAVWTDDKRRWWQWWTWWWLSWIESWVLEWTWVVLCLYTRNQLSTECISHSLIILLSSYLCMAIASYPCPLIITA